VRIVQREKETLLRRVSFAGTRGIPFHGSESAEDVPVPCPKSQSVCSGARCSGCETHAHRNRRGRCRVNCFFQNSSKSFGK
jgi:hypothetical protein